ncbi:unnamed protein product, partial [Rotaria magnacalcarata]
PLEVVSTTVGIAPEYQPVAIVPHRLDPTAFVGISVPPTPVNRTHREPEANVASSHSEPPGLLVFLDSSSIVV